MECIKGSRSVKKQYFGSKGFTLIEILIVIILIGVLAIALLSAINPVELLRKGRDTQRQADARELLGAYDRFYTTYGCYPWDGTACTTSTVQGTAVNPRFTVPGANEALLTEQDELKSQFANRDSVTNTDTNKRLFVSESTSNIVSVCFEPESTAARDGSLGTTMNVLNATADTCLATEAYGTAGCYVCIPQ